MDFGNGSYNELDMYCKGLDELFPIAEEDKIKEERVTNDN